MKGGRCSCIEGASTQGQRPVQCDPRFQHCCHHLCHYCFHGFHGFHGFHFFHHFFHHAHRWCTNIPATVDSTVDSTTRTPTAQNSPRICGPSSEWVQRL